MKSYIKARKKGTTQEEVIDGLKNYLAYIQFEKVDPQYIKMGSTWFNQECWNDDYLINDKKGNVNNGSNKKSNGSEFAEFI